MGVYKEEDEKVAYIR